MSRTHLPHRRREIGKARQKMPGLPHAARVLALHLQVVDDLAHAVNLSSKFTGAQFRALAINGSVELNNALVRVNIDLQKCGCFLSRQLRLDARGDPRCATLVSRS
jgi:hypothetical protein